MAKVKILVRFSYFMIYFERTFRNVLKIVADIKILLDIADLVYKLFLTSALLQRFYFLRLGKSHLRLSGYKLWPLEALQNRLQMDVCTHFCFKMHFKFNLYQIRFYDASNWYPI